MFKNITKLAQTLFFISIVFILSISASNAAGCAHTTNGTSQQWTYMVQNEFQDNQPLGQSVMACLRDLVASVPGYQYLDTPQRQAWGSASGSPVGAVLNPKVPINATILTPALNVNTTVSAASSGTTFYFMPGLYRTANITAKANDVFIGAPGAVLSGAVLLTGWGGSAGAYTIASPQGSGLTEANGTGVCNGGAQNCDYDIDIYYDGVPLFNNTGGTLATGQFQYNTGNGVLTMYDNPNGHTVETATQSRGMSIDVSGVTLENLVITKYSTNFQSGCVGPSAQGGADPSDTGILMLNIEVSLCHGYGVRFVYSGSSLLNSYIHDNGQVGVGGGSAPGGPPYVNGLLIMNNEFSYNNYAHFNCNNECGGLKIANMNTLWVIGNHAHHNIGGLPGQNDGSPSSDDGGYGLWCDIDCDHVVFNDNLVHDQHGPGIQLEEGCYFQVNGNIMYNDATTNTSTQEWGGEIMIPASHHGEVAYNKLGGPYGIKQPYQNRTDQGNNCGNPHPVGYTFVHDNEIICSSPTGSGSSCAGGATDGGASGSNAFSTDVYWNNHYGIQSCCSNGDFAWFTAYNGTTNGTTVGMTFATWQSYQDKTSGSPPMWPWASLIQQAPSFP